MVGSRRWTIPLDVDAYGGLEAQIEAFLDEQRIDGRPAFVIRMVVEEIVRNLIEHTPPYAADEQVEVRLDVEAELVRAVIEDERPPFDPLDAPELDVSAPLEERRAGGMGLHLVRNLADELTYERDGDRNRLTAAVTRS